MSIGAMAGAAATKFAAPAASTFLSSVGGLSGIGSLLGGIGSLMGKSGDGVSGKQMGAQRYQYAWQRKLEHDYWSHMQDRLEGFQRGMITDRVNDAKRAGVHPLFALGYSGNIPNAQVAMGGMPNIPGQSVTGSHKSDRMMGVANALINFEANKAQVQLTHAERDYYRALTRKTLQDTEAQPGVTTTPYTGSAGTVIEGQVIPDQLQGRFTVNPNEIISASKKYPGRVAGTKQMWQQWDSGLKYANGEKVIFDIPWSDEGPFEEFGPMKATATIFANKGRIKRLIEERVIKDWAEAKRMFNKHYRR